MRLVETSRSKVAIWVGAASIAIAAGASSPALADDRDEGVVGSWLGTATATTVPLPPLATLLTLSRDGTATEAHRPYLADSPLGPLLLTAGHGSWTRSGHGKISVKLMLIYEGAPNHPTAAGQVLSIETVRFKLALAPSHGALTGTLVDELRDNAGNVLFVGPGTFEATRIVPDHDGSEE